MIFLYIGPNPTRAQALGKALNRQNIQLEHAETPESAYFEILNADVTAVFVDLSEGSLNGPEVLTGLHSIDKDFETVLITPAQALEDYDPQMLRFGFGFITPAVEATSNQMVLTQLTDKITTKALLEKLKNNSIIDGLTQLYNHVYVQQQIDEEIHSRSSSKDTFSLIMLDIDHFKHYNDTNGHPAGDRVLKKVAELLTDSVRKFDLTGRYGGEEFVILLPATKAQTALRVCERIRLKIASTEFEFGDKQPLGFLSASFGVAAFDGERIQNKKALIHHADQALYRAKRHQRNCVWYFQGGSYKYFERTADPSLTVRH